MKKQISLSRAALIVAAITLLLLLVPFIAMQFTAEVDWGAGDFLLMGALIFSTGMAYVLLSRSSNHMAFKIACGLAVAATFLMIWANLAVGLVGSGPNAANLLLMATVFVVVIGALRSGFTAAGMEKVMYAAALCLALVAVITLVIGIDQQPGSSAVEILGVSGFFAGLYVVAGALFHYAGKDRVVQGT